MLRNNIWLLLIYSANYTDLYTKRVYFSFVVFLEWFHNVLFSIVIVNTFRVIQMLRFLFVTALSYRTFY